MRHIFHRYYKKYVHLLLFPCLALCFISVSGCDLTAITISPSTSEIEIEMGETVSFEGEGIGGTPWLDENGEPRYGYSWQTGGAPSNSGEKAVDVVYNYPGVYTASFTIRDKAGNKDTEYIQVTVLGEELEAIINSPPNIQTKTGQTLSLEGEGIGGVPFLDESDEPYYLYFWQTGISTSINKTVEVIYDTKGEYDISFTVTDRAGKADTKYIHLRVEPGGE